MVWLRRMGDCSSAWNQHFGLGVRHWGPFAIAWIYVLVPLTRRKLLLSTNKHRSLPCGIRDLCVAHSSSSYTKEGKREPMAITRILNIPICSLTLSFECKAFLGYLQHSTLPVFWHTSSFFKECNDRACSMKRDSHFFVTKLILSRISFQQWSSSAGQLCS